MTHGKIVRLLLTCLAVMVCCLTLAITTPQAHAQTVNRVIHANAHTQQAVTPQINRTDCDGRTDFLRIWSGSFLDCFANSGAITVRIVYVYRICSGNNFVVITYGTGSNGYAPDEYFPPGWCSSIPDDYSQGSTEVTRIYIN